MKPTICISCEGSVTKLTVFSKDKEGIKLHNTFSVNTANSSAPGSESISDFSMDDISSDISFDNIGEESGGESTADPSDVSAIAIALSHIKLNQAQFIPVLTEPALNYHIYEGEIIKDRTKQAEAIINDISKSKNITTSKDYLDWIEFGSNQLMCVFIEGDVPCLRLIDSLAQYNDKRFYKVSTLKSAELSLAYYVSKTTKFFPEDYSLIIYTGKDYSKLLFLEGQNLKHIGTTLDIGTENLHTYDVYFSKILLEMENGGIPRLDNVLLCGDDKSENLILSFYGTFPEANVTEIKFEDIDISELNDEDKENLPAYSIPISAGLEFFDEADEEYKGINILPKFIKEKQKMFQFSWHSIAMLPLLFVAALFFTVTIQQKTLEISEMQEEITRLKQLQAQNKVISDEINLLTVKISKFDETQAILDQATLGTEVWGEMLSNVSDFIERRRNFWIGNLSSVSSNEVKVSGFSLSRSSLTEFADFNNSALLKNILYEPLRENNAFAYSLNFKLYNELVDANGS